MHLVPRAALVAAALVLAPAVASAQSQTQDLSGRPVIIAAGVGQISRDPDYVRLAFNLHSSGATGVEALAALEQTRATVEAGVRGIKGVSRVEIRTAQATTQDVRGPHCPSVAVYLPNTPNAPANTGECAITGVSANLEVEVKVEPAARAGDVASLAGQLGGRSLQYRGSGINDDHALQGQATEAAVADARHEAEVLARAAGVRLGQVLRIQDQNAGLITPQYLAPLPVPSPPPPPPVAVAAVPVLATSIPYSPQPVNHTVRVTVVYALEPSGS